jgi:hypothetical protein
VSENAHTPLALAIPDELLDELARRVAAILASTRPPATTDGWLRGADQIAAHIGAPSSRVYALASCNPQRIPVERDGSALVARRSDLDQWLSDGGGRRP